MKIGNRLLLLRNQLLCCILVFVSSASTVVTTAPPALIGTPPICFLTEIPVTTSNTTADEYHDDDIGEVMYLLSGSRGGGVVERGNECYNGTTLNATLYVSPGVVFSSSGTDHEGATSIEYNDDAQQHSHDVDNNKGDNNKEEDDDDEKKGSILKVYAGSTIHFGIKLKVSVSEIINSIDEPIREDSFHFHSKFMLCDALKVGSCSPIMRTDLENNTVPVYSANQFAQPALYPDDEYDNGFYGSAPGPGDVGGEKEEPQGCFRSSNDESSEEEGIGCSNRTVPLSENNMTTPVIINRHTSSGGGHYDGHNNNSNHTAGDSDNYAEYNYTQWTLDTTNYENDHVFTADINVTLHVPIEGRAGAFFVVGEALLDFYEDDGEMIQRVVIASAIPKNAIFVSPAPVILSCSDSMKIFLGVVIGLGGAFALSCLIFILLNRKHPVLTLAQAPFLAALAGCCLIQTVFSFTFIPSNAIFCTIGGVMVIVPLHAGAAILVGRMWRVYTTLAAANVFGRQRSSSSNPNEEHRLNCFGWTPDIMLFLTWIARLPSTTCHPRGRRNRKVAARNSIRQGATNVETSSLIFLLTLPQLILQVFGATFYPKHIVTTLTADGDMGHVGCCAEGEWVMHVGVGLATLLYVMAVVVAWISRNLPSAFNETTRVFQSAAITTLLGLITFPLIIISTASIQNSPDIETFFRSLLSIGIAMNTLILIVLPKIRRVLSGEKVVMSTLLDSRFSKWGTNSNSQGISATPGDETESNSSGNSSDGDVPRVLGKEDPLPRSLEKHVVQLQDVLLSVTSKCCDGRPLTPHDWDRLRGEANLLQMELGRVNLSWEEEEQQQCVQLHQQPKTE